MEYENDKQVIFLKDLFFSILYRWKGILITVLIGAVLLGGLQLLRNSDAEDQALQDASIKEAQLLQSIALKETAIANQTEYLQESSLMNMDPYRLYKANLSFYVQNDYKIQPGVQFQNPDSTPALLNAYLQLLSDAKLTNQVAESIGINALYVRELFASQVSTGSIPGVLTVVITFDDQANLEKIAELTEKHLLSAADSIKTQLGEHTIRCTVTSVGLTTDANLATSQKQAANQLSTLNADLEKLTTQYESVAKAAKSTSVAFSAVIGGILGCICAAAYAFLAHLGSGKVYSDRILSSRTGIKVYGCVPSSGKIGPVKRFLRKAEGRNLREDAASVIAITIANCCSDAKHILLAGKCEQAVTDTLQQTLTASGIQVSCCEGLLHNAEALRLLPECDSVILIEQCAVSTYDDIAQAMVCVQDHNKLLLGCILIDG